jgi:hypothetical protein
MLQTITPQSVPNVLTTDIRYVFDCGTKGKFAKSLDREIVRLKAALNSQPLDFLFLSHLHADHISGLKQLFGGPDAVVVDTIVLPYLNDSERVFALADSIFEPTSDADIELLRGLATDPVGTVIERFRPRQVLVVGPEDELPGGEDELGRDPEPLMPRPGLDAAAKWRVLDEGAPRDQIRTRRVGDALVQRASRRTRIEVDFQNFNWVLKPYLPAWARKSSDDFWTTLCSRAGIDPTPNDGHELPVDVLKDLVNDLQSLKAAYTAVNTDLNATSLSLYSGPQGDVNGRPKQLSSYWWSAKFGGGWTVAAGGGKDDLLKVGWLGTGDANFGSPERVAELKSHLGLGANLVASLTLPHHGSANDFHVDLLTTFRPLIGAASAEFIQKNWRHPAPEVVQKLAEERVLLGCVTSDPRTELVEKVVFEFV